MLRGRSIEARPVPPPSPVIDAAATVDVAGRPLDRVLNTEQANTFLGRSKGFLEKRRSSGIDSPRYLQRRKRGAVLYRVSDLLAWEEERMLTASSEHEDGMRHFG